MTEVNKSKSGSVIVSEDGKKAILHLKDENGYIVHTTECNSLTEANTRLQAWREGKYVFLSD